jgi:hypothetical protein
MFYISVLVTCSIISSHLVFSAGELVALHSCPRFAATASVEADVRE